MDYSTVKQGDRDPTLIRMIWFGAIRIRARERSAEIVEDARGSMPIGQPSYGANLQLKEQSNHLREH